VAGRRLVLLGAGHAHVEVLRSFAQRPPGAALTLISPYTHVPYTGMIPGVVAGRYALDEATIDAARLAARAGADFIPAKAARIDAKRKIVVCEGGRELPYDAVSINIGAVARNPLRRSEGARIFATKPVEPFVAALGDLGAGEVAVIGAGHGGVELAAALKLGARVTLIAGRAGLSPSATPAARAMIARRLAARGVAVIDSVDALSADAAAVTLDDGRRIAADAIILAAGVAPPPLIAALGLPKDARGFLRVTTELQSEGDASIFAAGDCASVASVDKAGVYAVRQGPVLAANLRAALDGAPLRVFRPQTDYLTILSFWPDGAVAIRGALAAEGRWADRWKEQIDRRFVARHR
jgi:selenide,water dikinase